MADEVDYNKLGQLPDTGPGVTVHEGPNEAVTSGRMISANSPELILREKKFGLSANERARISLQAKEALGVFREPVVKAFERLEEVEDVLMAHESGEINEMTAREKISTLTGKPLHENATVKLVKDSMFVWGIGDGSGIKSEREWTYAAYYESAIIRPILDEFKVSQCELTNYFKEYHDEFGKALKHMSEENFGEDDFDEP